MTAVIYWKEYRQQRGIWLAVAALAVLLMIGVAGTLGRGSGLQVFDDQPVKSALTWIAYSLALAYGVVCGALLLAGEKEEATLVFLDSQSGQRYPLWQAKLKIGILLAFGQGLFLAFLGLCLRFAALDVVASLPVLGVDALIWGFVGGALCRNVLPAVLAGIGLMAGSWLVGAALGSAVALVLVKVLLAVAGTLVSRRIFCQPDLARESYAGRLGLRLPRAQRQPSAWYALLWLTLRQGRWVLILSLAATFVLAWVVNLKPLMFYPAATLLIGLVCGLAVFAPEQSGRQESFLGAQRLSPNTIWLVKVLFWLLAATCLTVLTWAIVDREAQRTSRAGDYWAKSWDGAGTADRDFFMALWAVYGFSLGQFVGLWARRTIVAAIVAGALGAALSALWLPSVLFGGLALWQVLGIPVLLLAGTRFFLFPWITGRLHSVRPLVGLAGLSAVIVVWQAAALAYRVSEVPDVGQPFDIEAFLAGIPSPEHNEAAALIRQAAQHVEQQRHIADAAVAPEPAVAAPAPAVPGFPGAPPGAGGPAAAPAFDPYSEVFDVPEKGLPKDPAFARWLDIMFNGEWFTEIKQATRLPLGVLFDPRQIEVNTPVLYLGNCRDIAALLAARALQMQERGQSAEALHYVEMILTLSRYLRDHSPMILYLIGEAVESHALSTQNRLLEKVGPDKALLQRHLAMLQEHRARLPDPLDPFKTEYFVFVNTLASKAGIGAFLEPVTPDGRRGQAPSTVDLVPPFAWHVAWEKERQESLTNALFQGRLRRLQKNGAAKLARKEPNTATEFGLPPPDGPGADLSPSRWSELIAQAWAFRFLSLQHLQNYSTSRVRLEGELVVTGLALYAAENGEFPPRLDDLVPRYLPSLPVDARSGRPFRYEVSRGGKINGRVLRPGQAVVWSDHEVFPVPLWNAKK